MSTLSVLAVLAASSFFSFCAPALWDWSFAWVERAQGRMVMLVAALIFLVLPTTIYTLGVLAAPVMWCVRWNIVHGRDPSAAALASLAAIVLQALAMAAGLDSLKRSWLKRLLPA